MIRKLDLEQRALAVAPEVSFRWTDDSKLATNRIRPRRRAAPGVRRGCHSLRGVALPLKSVYLSRKRATKVEVGGKRPRPLPQRRGS
jgi:hypothetical protein